MRGMVFFVNALGLGVTFEQITGSIITTALYDLFKHVLSKKWFAYTARREQYMDQFYPCHLGPRRRITIYDDETEGIKILLQDCWPEILLKAFEYNNEVLENVYSFNNLEDFYNGSRKAMTECKGKEIILFRHNAFDILKEDYPYIVEAIKRENTVKVIISGTIKNLKKNTEKELDFLRDNAVTQKLLLQKGLFCYSNDFNLNLLKNRFDSLLSLILLFDLMKKGDGNFKVFLYDSFSSIRGQIIEKGKTHFIRFPRHAPEHLGQGYSSESNELRDQILYEMSERKPLDVSDEERLGEVIKVSAGYVYESICENEELGNILTGKKVILKNELDSLGLSEIPQIEIDQNRLVDTHKKVLRTVLGSKGKTFKLYEYWKEYKKLERMYTGGFDQFLRFKKECSMEKRRFRDSKTEICYFSFKK
jgi:hypothetical protein